MEHLCQGKIIDVGTKNVGQAHRVGIPGRGDCCSLLNECVSVARIAKIFLWILL